MDFASPFQDTPAEPLPDPIASLVAMADSMEALLPPDFAAPPAAEMSAVTCSAPPHKMAAHAHAYAPPHATWLADDTADQAVEPLLAAAPFIPLELCTSPTTTTTTLTTSPCAVRELDLGCGGGGALAPQTRIHKAGHAGATGRGRTKTGRKPKTYSKPVASRFCHICSRMPRRGQGSATCRRMAEGLCRKIVCEQCLRDQGFDYAAIAARPEEWRCPHCSDICPPRSQCHIYNRINARRKRVGKGKKGVEVAVRSSDALLGPYGHLLQEQILQPPPNFRLNLPPQYSQL